MHKLKHWFIELADDLLFLGRKIVSESRQLYRYLSRLVVARRHRRPFIRRIIPISQSQLHMFRQPKAKGGYGFSYQDIYKPLSDPANPLNPLNPQNPLNPLHPFNHH